MDRDCVVTAGGGTGELVHPSRSVSLLWDQAGSLTEAAVTSVTQQETFGT